MPIFEKEMSGGFMITPMKMIFFSVDEQQVIADVI
jgi:hypothetical protein